MDIPRNETKKIRPQSVWVTSRYLNFPYRFGKFLCLTADIFARDPRDARDNQDGSATAVPQRRLKFMIDSGSDTVTVHYDVIRELRLPIKGAVIQEGAGGETQEKPLYSAYLGIGEKTLDIEVTARVFQVRPHSSPTLTFLYLFRLSPLSSFCCCCCCNFSFQRMFCSKIGQDYDVIEWNVVNTVTSGS